MSLITMSTPIALKLGHVKSSTGCINGLFQGPPELPPREAPTAKDKLSHTHTYGDYTIQAGINYATRTRLLNDNDHGARKDREAKLLRLKSTLVRSSSPDEDAATFGFNQLTRS